VDQEKIKLVQIFGGSRFQVLTKVLLPASFPNIINALKVNVGLSWVGVIVGEFLVSKAGLGYLIVYGGQVFKLDLVMTSVVILGMAAAIMYQGVVYLERFLLRKKSARVLISTFGRRIGNEKTSVVNDGCSFRVRPDFNRLRKFRK
jgi:NitT/TauT family transport system permease protein